MTASFSARARSPRLERMDVERIDEADFAACLRDVARINAATRAHAPTLAFLDRLWARRPERPLRILDVGFGYGDALRAIARHARRRGVAVDLRGIDINPWSERAARAVTPARDRIRYETADLFDERDEPVDVIFSSLFTHHLRDEQIVAFLRHMHANARRGWFVNDLHRHAIAYGTIAIATRLLRLHRFVQNDAPLSVARAFRRADWERLIARADLDGTPAIRWEPLFRYCVSFER